MPASLTFIELTRFSAVREEYLGSNEGYRALQNALIQEPEKGEVIPGAAGVRKMRWPDPRRGKGKRGGLRVIYLHIPDMAAIVFFAMYDKDEATDLTADEKKVIHRAADEVKAEINSGPRLKLKKQASNE